MLHGYLYTTHKMRQYMNRGRTGKKIERQGIYLLVIQTLDDICTSGNIIVPIINVVDFSLLLIFQTFHKIEVDCFCISCRIWMHRKGVSRSKCIAQHIMMSFIQSYIQTFLIIWEWFRFCQRFQYMVVPGWNM